jgi:hypothetical protein
MSALLLLGSLFLIGPLAMVFGTNSRDHDAKDARRWWPGEIR